MNILRSGHLKRILILPFFLLITIGFLLSWGLYINGSRQAVGVLIENLAEEISSNTKNRLESFLLPAQVITLGNGTYFSNFGDILQQQDQFSISGMFKQQIKFLESPVIISVAFSTGEYREAQSIKNGIQYGISGNTTQGDLRFYQPDLQTGEYDFAKPTEDEVKNYDPRLRPWYINALEAEGFTWSEIYNLSSTQEPAMSAILAFSTLSGLIGVTTTVIDLSTIQNLLSSFISEKQGLILLTDSQGNGIARSGGFEHITDQEILSLESRGVENHSIQGQIFLHRTRTLDETNTPGWSMNILLSQRNFHEPLTKADISTFFLMIILLICFFILAWKAISFITYPILILSESVSQNTLDKPFVNPKIYSIAQQNNELGRLANNYITMAERQHADLLRLQQNLREKETLLKEVHHRVKNNLQIISSLLNLQAGTLEDEKAIKAFEVCQDRIRAMAYIHENAYTSGLFSRIQMQTYFEQIADSLAMGFHHGTQPILKITVDAHYTELSLDTAIPCGLIVNELVSNSLKHGFHNRGKGEIHISLHIHGEIAELVIKDDGIGFDPFRKDKIRGIGMELVEALSDQIHGTVEWEFIEGTKFSLKFFLG